MVLERKAAWLGNSLEVYTGCNPSRKSSWAKDDLQLQALEGHPTQIMLDKMSTVAHAVVLRDLREDRLLLVANTHLQLGITNSSDDAEETQPQQWSSFTVWAIGTDKPALARVFWAAFWIGRDWLRYYHPKGNHIRLLQLYSLLKVLAQAANDAKWQGLHWTTPLEFCCRFQGKFPFPLSCFDFCSSSSFIFDPISWVCSLSMLGY